MTVLIILLVKRSKLHERVEIRQFCKKYGTFFEEFKETNISYWLFYVFYILRRLIVIIIINTNLDGSLQLAVYLIFALTVFYI